jgi:hypothetical protein
MKQIRGWSCYKTDGYSDNTHKYFPGQLLCGDSLVQMTTSSYVTAFQGVRALWGWLRKKEVEDSEPSARERAMDQAELERDVALLKAEEERAVAEVRAEARALRLQPVMAMFETVQANKRARLSAQPSGEVTTVDDDT